MIKFTAEKSFFNFKLKLISALLAAGLSYWCMRILSIIEANPQAPTAFYFFLAASCAVMICVYTVAIFMIIRGRKICYFADDAKIERKLGDRILTSIEYGEINEVTLAKGKNSPALALITAEKKSIAIPHLENEDVFIGLIKKHAGGKISAASLSGGTLIRIVFYASIAFTVYSALRIIALYR